MGRLTRISGPAALREEEEHRRSCNKSQREEEALVSLGLEARYFCGDFREEEEVAAIFKGPGRRRTPFEFYSYAPYTAS